MTTVSLLNVLVVSEYFTSAIGTISHCYILDFYSSLQRLISFALFFWSEYIDIDVHEIPIEAKIVTTISAVIKFG